MRTRLFPPTLAPLLAAIRRAGAGRRGFTLVEVVTTVALAMLVASVALPRLDPRSARVGLAAEGLVSVLTDAQRRAVRDGHDVVVRFDTLGTTSFVHFDVDNDGVLGAEERTELVGMPDGVAFHRGQVASMPQGDGAVTFHQRRGALPSVTFHADGSASEEGVLYLSAAGSSEPGEATVRAVEVARPTGHSVCHRLRSGRWEPGC